MSTLPFHPVGKILNMQVVKSATLKTFEKFVVEIFVKVYVFVLLHV